jgi:hypothetical protein
LNALDILAAFAAKMLLFNEIRIGAGRSLLPAPARSRFTVTDNYREADVIIAGGVIDKKAGKRVIRLDIFWRFL